MSSESSSDDSYDLDTEGSSDSHSLTSPESPPGPTEHQARGPPDPSRPRPIPQQHPDSMIPVSSDTQAKSSQRVAASESTRGATGGSTGAGPKGRTKRDVKRNAKRDATDARRDLQRNSDCNRTPTPSETPHPTQNPNTPNPQTSAPASQSGRELVIGKCPFGVRIVSDIVPDDHDGSDDVDDDETLPLNNMFVDVDERMFVGREEQFAELGRLLKESKVAGVSGMGGSGKTTFASLFAYRNRKRYKNGIFFVDASNINTLPFNFAQLAGPELLNLVRHPEEDIPTSIKLVTAWLLKNSNYLLIYDAADGPRIMEKLGKQHPTDNFRYIPPRLRLRGHVIITSRLPPEVFDLAQILCPVMLEDLDVKDTCEFLWRRVYYEDLHSDTTELTAGEQKALEQLVRECLPGRLPLNLEQTASFIRRQRLSFVDYLTEVMLCNKDRNPIGKPGFGDNRKTIDDAFIANFDAVAERQAEAGVLLNMAALCHSRDIPYALFTVGALALSRLEVMTEEGFSDLVDYLIEHMKEDAHGKQDVFESASAAGRLPILQLLAIPKESQLVKYTRSGQEFTVHEVIQQQLRQRMEDCSELYPALNILATILVYMMNSGDVSLANKRLFLPHAEKCIEHMSAFGPPPEEDARVPFIELNLRLCIKTAFVFAWLESFTTAWEMISDIEAEIQVQGSEQINIELLGLKARICVWQHRPAEALTHGLKGLELTRFGLALTDVTSLSNTNLDYLMEYASLRKSCAHALLTQFETDTDDIMKHLTEAMHVFRFITKRTNCREELAHLLMLYGLRHRNIGDRCPQTDLDRRLAEYRQARAWLQAAHTQMDPKNYVIDTCKVHLIMVEVQLGATSREDAVRDLITCREALDEKLGRNHRYTAWVLTKTARLLVDIGGTEHVTCALDLIRESLRIQDTVYDKDCGVVQKGQSKLFEGKALKLLGRYREAGQVLEEAERLLEGTPKNPAYTEIRLLLREARCLDQARSAQPGQHQDPRWLPQQKAHYQYQHLHQASGSGLSNGQSSQNAHVHGSAVVVNQNPRFKNNSGSGNDVIGRRKLETQEDDDFECPSLGVRGVPMGAKCLGGGARQSLHSTQSAQVDKHECRPDTRVSATGCCKNGSHRH